MANSREQQKQKNSTYQVIHSLRKKNKNTREKRLRNIIAAQQYRKRKKKELSDLKREITVLEKENKNLKEKNSELETENSNLKRKLQALEYKHSEQKNTTNIR